MDLDDAKAVEAGRQRFLRDNAELVGEMEASLKERIAPLEEGAALLDAELRKNAEWLERRDP